MRKLFLFLVLFSLLLSACQVRQKSDESESENTPDEIGMVELSSEGELVPMMLEASFMSDNQTFAYTFNYDANLFQLMDERLQGASVLGPSFKVEGGTEITGYTTWLADLDVVPELAAAQLFGRYQVYRYAFPEGFCTVERAVVQDSEEGLVLDLHVCPAQDAVLGKEALEALLTSLRLKDL
ncbi:MAG: hypothetical protein WC924_02115 [Candidatus Gracilibacteria bacterium]